MKFQVTTSDAYNLFHDGALALGRAEQQGMCIDVEYCERKKKQLIRKIERLENKLMQTKFIRHWQHSCKAKLNIYSDQQLSNYLYKTRKIEPTKMTTSGLQGATDNQALSQLGIPELDLIIQAKKLKKVRDTYLDAFLREQVNGVVHPFLNLNIARTYRSSSDKPNFQNIPKRDEEAMKIVRRAIIPRKGHQIVEIDYSGIEVCNSACYHKDPKMIEYICDPKSDMHLDMAKQIFMLDFMNKENQYHNKLRDAAKNGFVFPQFYGDYFVNCAENLACQWGKLPKDGRWKEGQGIKLEEGTLSDWFILNDIKSFKQFVSHVEKIEDDFWNNRFKVYQKWKDSWWEEYQKNGYIDMLTGFRCSGVMSYNQAINIPIQGSAFHCLLWAFIEIDRIAMEERWKSKPVEEIHDSILIDTHPDELDHVIKTVHRVTCEDLPKAWSWIIVPLSIDVEVCGIDESWDKKKPYKLAA